MSRSRHGIRLCRRSVRHGHLIAAGLVAVGLAGPPVLAQDGIPLIRDTEIENLLNDYAQPVFKAAGLGSGRVKVRIVRHDAFNAFVIDGRNVFIHTGTLAQSETPNQVIGVIAHEAGHISGGHMAALQSRLAREQTRMLLFRLLGIGVAIATGQAAAVAAADEVQVRSFLMERRSQESAADQAGLKFLNDTRQSARGMLETFERFAQQEFVSEALKDPFVRSHPVAVDRLRQLRTLVERSPYYQQKDAPQLQQRHDLMRAKLSGYLDRPQVVLNRYPASDQGLPARYARALARFFQGGQGGLEGAVAELDGLIRERPDNPYFHEVKGDILMRSGRPRDAIAPLRQALKLAGNANLVRVQLATALIAGNDRAVVAEAEDLLRKSLVEDQNPRAYRSLADASARLGKTPDADAAISQAYFLEGDVKQAQIFAKRAQKGLPQGSPSWIKMDDIINFKPRPE